MRRSTRIYRGTSSQDVIVSSWIVSYCIGYMSHQKKPGKQRRAREASVPVSLKRNCYGSPHRSSTSWLLVVRLSTSISSHARWSDEHAVHHPNVVIILSSRTENEVDRSKIVFTSLNTSRIVSLFSCLYGERPVIFYNTHITHTWLLTIRRIFSLVNSSAYILKYHLVVTLPQEICVFFRREILHLFDLRVLG